MSRIRKKKDLIKVKSTLTNREVPEEDDLCKRGFLSTPLYDIAKTLRTEGLELREKEALNDPYILTEFPTEKGRIDLWDQEKIFRAMNFHNFIVSISAPTAWWKSTFALGECLRNQSIYYQLGKTNKTSWSIKNVLYHASSLQERINEMATELQSDKKLWSSLLIDEQPQARTGRSGSQLTWSKDLEQEIRSLMLNLFFCSPILQAHVHHFIVEPRDWNVITRELRCLVYINTGQLIGSIITPFPPEHILDTYRSERKDIHLVDRLKLKNQSMQRELKVSALIVEIKDFMTEGVEGFPVVNFWLLRKPSQIQYIMDRFGITIMAQAEDILAKSKDFYEAKYGSLPKRKKKKRSDADE